VDRESAKRNMKTGLIVGGLATGIFALTFIVALLYVAP
jgi:hypothetical protein